MDPVFIRQLGLMLPPIMPFTYTPDRESAWRLYHALDGDARLADLRNSPLAPLVARPGVAPLVAASGDGILRHADLRALAYPDRAFGKNPLSPAGERAVRALMDTVWHRYQLSLAHWGTTRRTDWSWQQTSRPEPSLVLQLNFPASHQSDFWRAVQHCGKILRGRMECQSHPTRDDGVITAAWARLDGEPWGEEVLIEELQSDWFRRALQLQRHPHSLQIRDRAALDHYIRHVMPAYAAEWPKAMLLAVLVMCRSELGIRRVWLHQPHTGAKLKSIEWDLPPRSLYTSLPKRFGFTPTQEAPDFLDAKRRRQLAALRRSGKPLFWRFDL
ncbi:MAG: hypothetical protein AAF415_13135 [Pseudomonadota bacterium]